MGRFVSKFSIESCTGLLVGHFFTCFASNIRLVEGSVVATGYAIGFEYSRQKAMGYLDTLLFVFLAKTRKTYFSPFFT